MFHCFPETKDVFKLILTPIFKRENKSLRINVKYKYVKHKVVDYVSTFYSP